MSGTILMEFRRDASVAEALGKTADQIDRSIGGTQQESTGVRADHATVECAHNATIFNGSEIERILPTLCRHRGSPPFRAKSLLLNNFRWFGAPMRSNTVRNTG